MFDVGVDGQMGLDCDEVGSIPSDRCFHKLDVDFRTLGPSVDSQRIPCLQGVVKRGVGAQCGQPMVVRALKVLVTVSMDPRNQVEFHRCVQDHLECMTNMDFLDVVVHSNTEPLILVELFPSLSRRPNWNQMQYDGLDGWSRVDLDLHLDFQLQLGPSFR